MRMAVFRFLVTPAELWMRMVGWALGLDTRFQSGGDNQPVYLPAYQLQLHMSDDHLMMRISLGPVSTVLNAQEATDYCGAMGDVIKDMRWPGVATNPRDRTE